MRILIIPNSFKECADSSTVAKTLAKKLIKCSGVEIESLPLSDGGDGFLSVCREKYQLKTIRYKIPRLAGKGYKYVPVGYSPKDRIVFLEVADVIGIKDVPLDSRDPLNYNSYPLGLLLKKISFYFAKRSVKLKKIVIGIGGTGTSDLGLGVCSAFGLKLYDKDDKELAAIPGNFIRAAKISRPYMYDFDLQLVTDVRIHLLGEFGTTFFFARQKGVKEEELPELEEGVKNILAIIKRDFNADYSDTLLGAGGGLGLGFSLLTDPVVVGASRFLNKTLMLKEKIENTDLIVTGEGRFDLQSLFNKATGVVIKEAMRQKKKVVLIAGTTDDIAVKNLGRKVTIFNLSNHFANREESILNFRRGLNLASDFIAGLLYEENKIGAA